MSSASDFGKELGLVHEAVVTGRKVGADRDFWSILAHDEQKFREVVELVRGRPSYEVIVNRDLSRAESIEAGKYDWVNSDITQEHFPVKGSGKQNVNIVLFHFNRTITSDEVIAEMEKAGYRPADIDELLGLGVVNPDLQKEFPIVGLGSVWRGPGGSRRVPYLGWGGVERDLDLHWFGNGWGARCRFAAVRKSK